jgi:hypothetical protein
MSTLEDISFFTYVLADFSSLVVLTMTIFGQNKKTMAAICMSKLILLQSKSFFGMSLMRD